MSDLAPPPGAGKEDPEATLTRADFGFPEEPFACPACGQMLAASCHVCVACKQPIDPAQIRKARPSPTALSVSESEPLPQPQAPARFSWPIFFGVLLVSLFLAIVVQAIWGPVKGPLVMGGAQILTSAWVFYDAHLKRVPKPLRWGVGALLLWIVVFPWYLARRRTPQAPCPFVEAEVGPLSRFLLLALMLFFLLGIVLAIFKGPPTR